jgi:predicted nucleic acid-binding protein
MSGSKMMLDTNIALYLLGGDQVLAAVLDEKEVFVSVISEMEMLGYTGISSEEIIRIKTFLAETSIVELSPEVKNKTIELRQFYNIKLPDAIIAATAILQNIPLISADGIFKRIVELNFVHYEI